MNDEDYNVCFPCSTHFYIFHLDTNPKIYFKPKHLKLTSCSKLLIHCSRETPKWVFDKQCRPRQYAAEWGVWSGSPMFANSSIIFLRKYKSHSLTNLKSKLESSNIRESSFSLQWVKYIRKKMIPFHLNSLSDLHNNNGGSQRVTSHGEPQEGILSKGSRWIIPPFFIIMMC